MAKGQDDPADRDDGKVLAPEELDISDDEHVAELEEGRYVVSPNDPIDDSDSTPVSTVDSSGESHAPEPESPEPKKRAGPSPPKPDSRQSAESTDAVPSQQSEQTLTEQQVHDWLSAEFDDANSRYGFDVTAKFDGATRQRRMMSNDVVTIFESLILWYAQHIDSDTPVEEVLGILLMESNVPIRYPPESLKRLVQSSGLHPDDTIADLMDAIGDDGLKF